MRTRGVDWKQGLLVGVLVLLALWLASLIWGLAAKSQLAWREAHQTESQYRELEERKASLSASLEGLKTTRGEDAAIREAFGVARPGEEVIVVVPPASSTPTSTPPWWRRALNWF